MIRKPKKKVCQFCKEKATGVDYKDTTLLRKFISDRGKIRARRVTGNCVQHQRDVAIAVKNAREVALLPYTLHRSLRGIDSMKLILTQEVDGLGSPGDIVEVKDGYGRNYLIPAQRRRPLDARRTEAGRLDQGRPCHPLVCATSTTPSPSRASWRPHRST